MVTVDTPNHPLAFQLIRFSDDPLIYLDLGVNQLEPTQAAPTTHQIVQATNYKFRNGIKK